MNRTNRTRRRHSAIGSPVVTPLSPHISPIHDFYGYVNHVWEHQTPIPPYAHTIGVSEEIEEVVKKQLIHAITVVQHKDPNHRLSVVANSLLHARAQHHSIEAMKSLFTKFISTKTVEELGDHIGYLNRVQSHAPLSFVISSDSNDSKQCIVFVYEPELALPEKHLYTGHTDRDVQARHALHRLLEESQRHLSLPKAFAFSSAFALEKGLLPHLSKVEDRKDITFYYNPVTYADLESTYPALPWRAMLTGLGCSSEVFERARYIVTNDGWVRHLQAMLRTTPLSMWGSWMSSQLLTTFIEYMPAPFKDYHYDLYGKILRGSKSPLPPSHVMLKAFQTYAPQSLSRVFVDTVLAKGTKEEATKLVHSLKAATKARIDGLEWMSADTKAEAQKKLEAMRFQVAYPEKWESELDRTHLHPEHPLQNILSLAETDTKSMIEDLTKGNCGKLEGEWEEGAFEVNAYYYPDGNMMAIPAGILQPPFFDLKKSRAWNLGGIGAAIGHEITHGFDDDGRKYDSEGNFRSWWQPSDAETFTHMSHEVEALYEGVKTPHGHVNGKHTLSENLADLGGVAIALEALQTEMASASPEELKRAYKEFFISYAVSWRTKQQPEKAKQALLLDRHAPASLRVNLIVKQFAEFFEAFGDPSHEAAEPKKRIVFW
jgi:putative endopeptidase